MNGGLQRVGQQLIGHPGDVRIHTDAFGKKVLRVTRKANGTCSPLAKTLHEGISLKTRLHPAFLTGRHKKNIADVVGFRSNAVDLDKARAAIGAFHLKHRATLWQRKPCLHPVAINTAVDIHVLLCHLGKRESLHLTHRIGQSLGLVLGNGRHPYRR